MDNEFRELVNGLLESYEIAYNLCNYRIEKIINNQVKDINFIEHTLDMALDIYTDKGFYLFLKLLSYYQTVNLERANDYLEILKEDRQEEYDEYVKKIGKKKD